MLARCFIAINLPKYLKEDLTPILKLLREKGIQTTPPKNLHFTLKFLGDLRQDQIQKTMEILSKIKFEEFKVKLEGVGAFPNEKYVRVVWAGAQSKKLQKLALNVNASLKGLFKEEEFTPHLTLGRVKRKTDLSEFFKSHQVDPLGSFKARSFELMQSQLSKHGSIYSVLWSSSEE